MEISNLLRGFEPGRQRCGLVALTTMLPCADVAEIPEPRQCHQPIPGHIPSFQTPRPTIFSAPPCPNTRLHPSNTWTGQIPLIESRVPSVALLPHPPFPLNQAFHLCLFFPHVGFQQNVSMIAHSNPRGSPTSNRSTHRH